MRPQAGGGATPITPKNGFSGSGLLLPWQPDLILLDVDREVTAERVGKILRQRAEERQDHRPAPVLPEHEVEHIDLEHGADAGAFHRDRPGDRMRPRPALRAIKDRAMFGENLEARVLGKVPGLTGDRIDDDFRARLDLDDRRRRGVEEAPFHALRRGGDLHGFCHGPTPPMPAEAFTLAAALQTE